MSLNNLSTLQFNYNLNGLQDISTGEGNVLPVVGGSNINVSNDTTQYIVNLDDNITISTITAGTGTFNHINAPTGSINFLNTNQINFNTSYNGGFDQTGALYYDNSENTKTLHLILDNNVSHHIGEELLYRVKATSTITKGQCVMFDGTLGSSGILLGKPASGNIIPEYMIGIALETISTNGFGYVSSFGYFRGIDTNSFNEGNLLYYDPTVTGGLTNVEPSAPNTKILMAAVVNKGNSSNGSIFIRLSIFPRLSDLNQVSITGASNNDLFFYDGTKWINKPRNDALNGISLTGATIQNLVCGTGIFNTIISTNINNNNKITTQNLEFFLATGTTINTIQVNTDGITSNFINNTFYNSLSHNILYSASNQTTLSANNDTINFQPKGLYDITNRATLSNLGRFTVPSITVNDITSNSINSVDGIFTTLKTTNFTGTNANITNANITNANITNLTNMTFTGTNASITNLTTTSLTGTNASITNIVNTTFTGTTMFVDTIKVADGLASSPSISYKNDTDTGFYRVGSDNVALSLGNSQKVNFQTNLITFGSSSNNSVGGAINGDLQIGRTNFSNTSLINFGFTGSVYGVNPSRSGFITNDATNMTIANTQATTGSNSVGSIFITPASSSNTWIKRPNGQMINNARGFTNDYTSYLVNFNTGAFGLLLQNPNQEAYLFSTQTFGNHSAHTMHGAVSNVMSNLTIGRTNYPFSAEEALTLRPWSNTGSRTTEIKIANTVDEAFGYTIFGMSPTGHTSGGKAVSNFGFISNSNSLGGFYICTNTNTTVPNTYPRYFVDASGNHEFSLSSITGCFSITSSPYSVGIGTSFSSTRGQGRYVPLAVASLTNTTYTGGSEFLVRGSSSSANNHSAFTTNQFSADWKGVYDIRYNINMNTSTADDTVYVRIKVGGTTRQVSNYRISTLSSNASGSLLFNCTAGQLIELFIQGDTRNVNMNNDSTFTICYVG